MQASATRDLHRDVHIEDTSPLITPIELVDKLPTTARVERAVESGRGQVRKILSGEDHRFVLIVGPCSIHDEDATLDYAQRLLNYAE